MKKSASCSGGSPRGCNVSPSAAVSNPAVPTYAGLIPLSKNLLRWPASAAPRFRRESPWGLARAPACGAWGTIPTRRGCSRPLPGTRIWRGFDLHANVAVPAADRTRLEQLCRYLLRPAVAQDRLRLLDDGRIVLTLKTAWADGTQHLVFEPLELLERLAAITPRPRINLVLYHGVLAPHARWRARVVAYGATPVSRPVPASPSAKGSASDDTATTPNPRHWAWADLMRRAFDIDVLACPRCGGRPRLIATLEDPDAIRAILAALAASRERADRAPPFAASLDTSHTAAI